VADKVIRGAVPPVLAIRAHEDEEDVTDVG